MFWLTFGKVIKPMIMVVKHGTRAWFLLPALLLTLTKSLESFVPAISYIYNIETWLFFFSFPFTNSWNSDKDVNIQSSLKELSQQKSWVSKCSIKITKVLNLHFLNITKTTVIMLTIAFFPSSHSICRLPAILCTLSFSL